MILAIQIATADVGGQAPAPVAPDGQSIQDQLADGSKGPALVLLPAGSFDMGSGGAEAGRSGDEAPQHRVTISRAFALGRHEVTVAEYRRFVLSTRYRTDAERDGGCFYWAGQWRLADDTDWRNPPGFDQDERHPVVCVSWNDAMAYVDWLAAQTAKPYRLPTEAEWEYAARDGNTASRPWGEDPHRACRWANVADLALKSRYPGEWPEHACRDGHVHTAPANALAPSQFGFSDLLGNVWEWTCSGYQQRYRGSESRCAGASESGLRVYRGGSWYSFPDYARSAARSASSAEFRAGILGFRVARDR